MYADPVRLWLHNTDQGGWYTARLVFGTIDNRTQLIDALEDLKRSSIDYYATIRSAYAQRRAAEVADRDASAAADIPDYSRNEE